MGTQLFDQFTLLHFSFGVIAYFFGINWWVWLLIHTIFEIIENSSQGIAFNNKYLHFFWPGGKPGPDTFTNSVGDTIGTMMGWFIAKSLDNIYINKLKSKV